MPKVLLLIINTKPFSHQKQNNNFLNFICRFTGIEGASERTFDWNPCTPFDTDNGCKDTLVGVRTLKGLIE